MLTQNKGLVLMLNLSSLSYILLPFLGVLLPLIMWLGNRKKVSDMDQVGRCVLNFQLTWLIVLVGWFLVIIYGQDSMLSALNELVASIGSKLRVQETVILLLYFYNFMFVALNTVLISKQKRLIFFPSLPFFGNIKQDNLKA